MRSESGIVETARGERVLGLLPRLTVFGVILTAVVFLTLAISSLQGTFPSGYWQTLGLGLFAASLLVAVLFWQPGEAASLGKRGSYLARREAWRRVNQDERVTGMVMVLLLGSLALILAALGPNAVWIVLSIQGGLWILVSILSVTVHATPLGNRIGLLQRTPNRGPSCKACNRDCLWLQGLGRWYCPNCHTVY